VRLHVSSDTMLLTSLMLFIFIIYVAEFLFFGSMLYEDFNIEVNTNAGWWYSTYSIFALFFKILTFDIPYLPFEVRTIILICVFTPIVYMLIRIIRGGG